MKYAIIAFAVLCVCGAVRRPPGLPKPKTSTLNPSVINGALEACHKRVLTGRRHIGEHKNFAACFKDYFVTPKVKPAAASLMKSMQQCTGPGGIGSESNLYRLFKSCVYNLAG